MFVEISFWAVSCLVLGIVLVGIEVFTPGFGIPGASGMALLALSIVLQAKTLGEALIIGAIIIVTIGIMVAIAVKSVASGRLSRSKIILSSRLNKEEGYSAVANLEDLLGKEGVCLTPLRPSGTVEIGGSKYDVVSDLDFVNAGERVVISAVEGRRVVASRVGEKDE